MKILAIIPARAGSKRLPFKNNLKLNGKPLICYTIDAALKSNCFSGIIISTNSPEIKKIVRKYKKKNKEIILEERPEILAQDDTPMEKVVLPILEKYPDYEYFVLLQPTSPLRDYKDIRGLIKGIKIGYKKVASVNMKNKWNGAMILSECENFKNNSTFKTEKFKADFNYIMSDEKSIDINTEEDFKMAGKYLRKAK